MARKLGQNKVPFGDLAFGLLFLLSFMCLLYELLLPHVTTANCTRDSNHAGRTSKKPLKCTISYLIRTELQRDMERFALM